MQLTWFAKDLTELIGPIVAGRLYVTLAPTGTGKTLFTLNVTDGLLQQEGLRLLVVPTEESSRFYELMGCRQARVSYRDFFYGELSSMEADGVLAWAKQYRDRADLRLVPGQPSFTDILDALKAWPADVLLVDHAHLLTLPGRSMPEGLEHVMVWMQELADKLSIPVILMVQVHRPQGRDYLNPYRIPSVYSGKGTSKIEQCADIALGLSRKLKDDVDSKTIARLSRGLLRRHEDIRQYEEPNTARITCLKHRIDDEARGRSILLTVTLGKMQDRLWVMDGTSESAMEMDPDAPPF